MDSKKLYFDYNLIKEEVTSSWSRCLKDNRNRIIDHSKLTNPQNNQKKYINNSIKQYFQKQVSEINQKIKPEFCFFLINHNYIIEEIACSFNLKIELEHKGITKGFSFSEEYSGTNAVFLAGKLEKPVHILPGHHFCKPLNSWYSIAYPIILKQQLIGFINVISKDKIESEIICLTELLVNNLKLKIVTKKKKEPKLNYTNKLSDKQFYILKKIANGLTEKALASDLNLSISTIKYHKKKLFNFFNADSNIEMVVKAFKKGLLSFNEVTF